MIHTYHVLGMHCEACIEKVRSAIASVPNVESVNVNLADSKASITMKSHVALEALNSALRLAGAYSLKEENYHQSVKSPGESLTVYYPLLLVFIFLIGVSTIATLKTSTSGMTSWMANFMYGFFISFSFFKLLDLKGFAAAYSSYDIIAKRWYTFGYIYPFIEVILGLGYLLAPTSLVLSCATAIIMSVSIVGVIESVKNKRRIQCACLGTVFNLPMGTITIIEDALMIAMSLMMIGAELLS